jgi:glutathione S-transferase
MSWKLYYWGGAFKGRGEYVRLMFELAGVTYEEVNDVQQLLTCIDRGGANGSASYPAFTVPLIVTPEGDSISQPPAIMAFLGKRFGYYPENEMDEFHALQIVNTVADFHAEGRACFHPVDIMASYHTQEKEAEASSKKFASSRLIAWLKHM